MGPVFYWSQSLLLQVGLLRSSLQTAPRGWVSIPSSSGRSSKSSGPPSSPGGPTSQSLLLQVGLLSRFAGRASMLSLKSQSLLLQVGLLSSILGLLLDEQGSLNPFFFRSVF